MKRLLLLVCVLSVVLLTGCDVWSLLAGSPEVTEIMEELEGWMAHSDYTVTLRVRRSRQESTVTNPIMWFVEGEIELAMRPFAGPDMFLFGDAPAAAGWTFADGRCEGSGAWPVRLVAAGFLHGEPDCAINLDVVETWIGGGPSVWTCAGITRTAVNETRGYCFENLTFNAGNAFALLLATGGIPSLGAPRSEFYSWSWSSSWEITYIDAPAITGCTFTLLND